MKPWEAIGIAVLMLLAATLSLTTLGRLRLESKLGENQQVESVKELSSEAKIIQKLLDHKKVNWLEMGSVKRDPFVFAVRFAGDLNVSVEVLMQAMADLQVSLPASKNYR